MSVSQDNTEYQRHNIDYFRQLFMEYDADEVWERVTPEILHEILESANWSLKIEDVQRFRRVLDNLASSSQIETVKLIYLAEILENLPNIAMPGYGLDFPHDYIGIGGELI